MNVGEIYAKFKLDTGDFNKRVGEVVGGLKNVEVGAGAATPPINSLGASIQSMALKAAAALGLYKLGDALVSTIKESTLLASRVETLGVVMATVGRNVGLNAQQMDNYAKGVTAMGITTQVSRETVIRMVQAQMDLTQATKLARIAQDAAVVGNTNSSDALQKMIYGIQTGQIEVLKTIGLNVNFETSYKKMAAQLGKTTDDLNELEKMQARSNVVMEAGARLAGTYESAMGTVGKQLNTMPRYIEELKVKIGELFTPALSGIVTGLTDALKNLLTWFESPENKSLLKEWTDRFKLFGEGIGGAALAVSDLITWIGRLGSKPPISEEYLDNLRKIKWYEEQIRAGAPSSVINRLFGVGYEEDIERLKKRNAELMAEWKKMALAGQVGREGAAWGLFAGEAGGAQQFTVDDTAEKAKQAQKQRELQEKFNQDISKLREDQFSEFAFDFEKREKLAKDDSKSLILLNEWAVLKSGKIWEEYDEKVNVMRQKSAEDYLLALEKETIAKGDAMREEYEAEVKLNEQTKELQAKSTEDFILGNYKRIEENYKLDQKLFEAEKKLSIERITLEAESYKDLRGYAVEHYQAQIKLIESRAEMLKRAGVNEIAIAQWVKQEKARALEDEKIQGESVLEGLAAARDRFYREEAKAGKVGEKIWGDIQSRKNQATNEFVDNFMRGQDMMVSAQKAAGDMMTNLAGDISKRMWAAMIDKVVGMIGAHIGGGASLVAWQGANKGGVAGALAEIGIYLGTAVAAMLAGRGMAQAFKAKGGWMEEHPMGGWIQKGSGIKDDVFLGTTPGVRHWGMKDEFIVNKNSAAKFAPLLEIINKPHAEGGPVGTQADWSNVADGLVMGSGFSFLHGFMTKGGLLGGILEAIAFNATAIPSMFGSKFMADKFRAKGGWMEDIGYGFFDMIPLPRLPFDIPLIPGLPGLLQPKSYLDPQEGRRLILDLVRAPYEQIAKDILTPNKYWSEPIDLVGNLLHNIQNVGENLLFPKFHEGIDYVPRTGPAILERGERVISKGDNRPIQINLMLEGRVLSSYIYDQTKAGNKMIHPRGMATS